METILFNVQNQTITTFRDSFVSTTIGAYKCKFVFDNEWQGMQKTAVFIRKDVEPIQMLLDANDECSFADELINCDGYISVGVYGTKDGVRYPTVSTRMLAIVQGVCEGAIPTPPTPSVYEQLLSQFNNLTHALEEEVQRAETKETELNEAIENESNRAIARENEIEDKIPSIEHLATRAELNAEKQARENSDDELSQSIADEKASREAKDTSLEQSISDEETRAKQAEKALQDSKQENINDLETIRSGASKGATAVQDNNYVHTDNNYTTTEKQKLGGIEEGANKYILPSDVVKDANYVHTDNNFTTQEKTKLQGLENYDDSEVKQAIQDVASDVLELEGRVDNLIDDNDIVEDKTWSSKQINDADERLRERIGQIESSKIPNVIFHGTPTINGSQVSGFSPTNYCTFPFLMNLYLPFEIKFAIQTGNDVVNQQNILDSDFGLAFAIRESRFVIALSTNGTSWDLGEGIGSLVIQPNTSYLIKISWNGSVYEVSYSLDGGNTYVVDITKTSSSQLAPKQMYIGVGENDATIMNSFGGIIDFQYASLSMNNVVVWLGFADIGLLTRLSVDLENIDEDGINKIKSIIYGIKDNLVKDGLVHNEIELTDEEKLAIETWLGLSENYLTYYNETPYQVNKDYIPVHKKYAEEKFVSVDAQNFTEVKKQQARDNIDIVGADYQGVDLTIKFADEIANYADEWAWISARAKAGNFKGLNYRDYIPVTCTNGKVLREEIVGMDTYYHNGSPEIGHHIDFISKECWDVTVQYNLVNYNNGNDEDPHPFMISNVKRFLMSEKGNVPYTTDESTTVTTANLTKREVDYTNGGVWKFLPDKLKNVIVPKNIFDNTRYTAGTIRTTDNTNWGWTDLPKLWLPYETEIYGRREFSGSDAYQRYGKQYPAFIGHNWFKGYIGALNTRCSWWLLPPGAGTSAYLCAVGSIGNVSNNIASTSGRVPVCFRVA